MKKIMLIAAAALALAACNKTKTYTVEGNIEGLTGTVTLSLGNEALATAESTDGTFTLVCKTEAPEIVTLNSSDKRLTLIFLEEGAIKVEGNLDEPEKIAVSGTPSNEIMTENSTKINEIAMQYFDPTRSEAERKEIYAAYEEAMSNAYEANKGKNMYGIYLMTNQMIYEMTPDDILTAVAEYPAELQKSSALQSAKKQAEAMKRVAVGAKFIEIEQNDPEGTPIKLSDIVAANKYTLVDFWASWCGPCMGELPFLTADYASYHDKGFEIYGVSLDRKADDWVKCIADKGLVWPNVSEVNMWDNTAAKAYAVRSIPSNFLIAQDGTIVATNLRGKALGEKLAELLK